MCGIGGFQLKDAEAVNPEGLLMDMQKIQQHRGPDGCGVWNSEDRRTGLCQSRLAIVDLSPAGSQPMHSKNTKLTITCNGEIYNWKSLRCELEKTGLEFHTQSDIEVILAGYQKWGYEVLKRLRGMFAFALWDRDKQELFCARDNIGKKPFVYAENQNGFFFASELPALKAISSSAKINVEVNPSALGNMLLHNLRHIPEPLTVYKGIQKLRPGHALILKGGVIQKMWRHWNPAPIEMSSPDQLREVIEDAVAIRSVADVPVGAFLSGGVDSTAIVNLMQKHNSEPIHTYAFGANKKDEDLVRARFVAKKLGTLHKEFYFDPETQFNDFKKILNVYGEPIMLLPLIHAYQLSKEVYRDGIKVVLNGNGADELFYGYTGHIRTAKVTRIMRLFGWLRTIYPNTNHRDLSVFFAEPGRRKSVFYRKKAELLWPSIFKPHAIDTLVHTASDEMESWGKLLPNKHFIDESNYLSLIIDNAHSLTIASDLPGMMASVEMRSPFLDQNIISAAMGIHFLQKVQGPKDGSGLKHILRMAVNDLVPKEVMRAPKRGFGMSIQERDVLLGPWKKHADEIFNDYPYSNLFDGRTIRKMWLTAKENKTGRWDLLAKLFAIGIWKSEET
jgi:asparagine synthase (glutamine-hydrolysing)